MAVVIATLLDRRPPLHMLRRVLGRSVRVLQGRTPAHLATLLHRELLDLVVIGAGVARSPMLEWLRRDYPALPLLWYVPLRTDDATLLHALGRERLIAVAVEGVDDPVLGRLVARHGVTARRLRALRPLAAPLQLHDDFQRRAWEILIRQAPSGMATATVAAQLGVSRETLSRRFAAGGAPGLKRAIDAVRLFAAGGLLGNPAFGVEDAARLLGFSSASLLQRTARRTLGVAARELTTLSDDLWEERLVAPGGWR